MAQRIFKTDKPVALDGFQCIFKPGKFGYSLSAIIDQELVDELEEDRIEVLKWAESKLKNPKRSTLKPEPWEETETGSYRVKFRWEADARPPIVDTEGTPITDENTPLYNGLVKIGFRQKPYILKDGVTYGTSLKLVGVQVVSIESGVGVDRGDLDDAAVAELFGKTAGFKTNDPNVVVAAADVDPDDDF